MKKIVLSLIVIMLSGISVKAANWQPVNTLNPDVSLYVDTDSIRKINDTECLYAIKYQVSDQIQKVAYIKSNYSNNLVGVIYANDFEEEKYNPAVYFNNPHVYMKSLNKDSFLNSSEEYVSSIMSSIVNNSSIPDKGNMVLRSELPVAYRGTVNKTEEVLSPSELQEYLVNTCKLLEANWNPPIVGRDTRGILLLTIGRDGSLLGYQIKESTGVEAIDRSIISAIEQTVPYPKFPSYVKDNVYSLDFQFVFEHDLFNKAVVY